MNEEHNSTSSECILSIKLLTDGLDHMNDIMKVAKNKHAPSYTKQLLSAEWEAIFKAYRGMKEHESKYGTTVESDDVILMLIEIAENDYNRVKENYENYLKHISSLK